MKMKKDRKGIAMIELIFAIVIMGFVMLSIPMLMMQVKESSKLSSKQESIAMIATQMNLIMTQQWDDIQTRSNNDSFIVTTNGVDSLKQNGTSTFRGSRTKFQNTRIFANPNINASTTLGIELNDKPANAVMDDVDDYNNFSVNLVVQEATPNLNTDYIDNEINITTTVSYVSYGDNFNGSALTPNPSNTALSTTSNIKLIEGLLTTSNSSELSKNTNIKLRAFSSNIGGYDVETVGGI